MKKLVIFLILFIISIPAVAKDKSLFTENFSLINRSEAESLAESYLRRLEKSNEKSRKTWGYVGLVGGGICLGLGAAALSAAEKTDVWEGFWIALGGAALITGGIVGVGSGILFLAIKSSAEKEYDAVLRITDAAQRERASHKALSSLAARSRLKRMITSGVFAALAVYSFVKDEENSSPAAVFGGFAAYNLLRKSRAERTYQNYLKEKEYRKELALRLDIMPHGGVKMGLGFSF
jgi:hypothetical protein